MNRFVRDPANVLVADQIDVARVVLDHQDAFAEQNKVGSWNGIRDIFRNIDTKRLERNRVEQLLDLFSYESDFSRI